MLSFACSLGFFILFYTGRRKIITNLNSLNPSLKNYILTLYELDKKKIKNAVEEEFLKESGEIKEKIEIYYDKKFRNLLLKIFVSIYLVFALYIFLIPMSITNLFELTRKDAVIMPCKSHVEMISFNLGECGGSYYSSYKGKSERYNLKNDIPFTAKIYFQGPGVRSNELSNVFFGKNRADSIKILVNPAAYQKGSSFRDHLH